MDVTLNNLERAFTEESKAHMLYRYFARRARAEGYPELADQFEHTAGQELEHAHCLLELMVGRMTVLQCLELTISGEEQQISFYPEYLTAARAELDALDQQPVIPALADNVAKYRATLERAEKCFRALVEVEIRHHAKYQEILEDFKKSVV